MSFFVAWHDRFQPASMKLSILRRREKTHESRTFAIIGAIAPRLVRFRSIPFFTLAFVAGVWKERQREFWAREEGGKETPARKPGRLLVFASSPTNFVCKNKAAVMTSCQISLDANIHFIVLAFVFLKQEIWREQVVKVRTIKTSSNAVVRWKKKVATMPGLLCKIHHKSITSFAEGSMLDVATCTQCLSEKNLKHFAGSRIGSSGAYGKTLPSLLARSSRFSRA